MGVDILFTILTLIYGFCLGVIMMVVLINLQHRRSHTRAVIDDVSDQVVNATGYKSITLDC